MIDVTGGRGKARAENPALKNRSETTFPKPRKRCNDYAFEIAVTSAITTTKAKQRSEKSNDWVFCTVIQASPDKKTKHAGPVDQRLNPAAGTEPPEYFRTPRNTSKLLG
jgi:hypothetical protein